MVVPGRKGDSSFYASASRMKSAANAVASGPCESLYASESSPPLHAWPSAATDTWRTTSRPSRCQSRVVVMRPCTIAGGPGWGAGPRGLIVEPQILADQRGGVDRRDDVVGLAV